MLNDGARRRRWPPQRRRCLTQHHLDPEKPQAARGDPVGRRAARRPGPRWDRCCSPPRTIWTPSSKRSAPAAAACC
ncbi:hypothetical protein ACRAWD_07570 [Caulobacter segnis]